LEQKVGITNPKDLKERILSHCETLNIQGQINDVEGFLFHQKDEKSVRLFGDIFKQANL
jgi:hypothetical protein